MKYRIKSATTGPVRQVLGVENEAQGLPQEPDDGSTSD